MIESNSLAGNMNFNQPPQLNNFKGKKRKVGFEFEFAGLEFEETVQLIIDLFGGEHKQIKKYWHEVRNSKLGDFSVEFDSWILKNFPYEKYLKNIGINLESFNLSEPLEELLGTIAGTLVPREVCLPPIPIDQLENVERFRKRLHEQKAKGTGSSLFYAFALHINAEIPDDSVRSVLNHLKAFLILKPWISVQSKIDFTREMITPYINDFPVDFQRKVLHPSYSPDLETFTQDYLQFNPTRNRPLDLLPLLSHLKGEPLSNIKEGEEQLVKPRPTYHYRLPNCLIDDPDWSVAKEWNYWVEVEKLANEENKLKQWSEEMLTTLNEEVFNWEKKWAERMQYYVSDEFEG